MSRNRLLFAVLIASIPLVPVSARGQQYQSVYSGPPESLLEPGFQGRLDVPFSTQYVWRGLELNHQSVCQPALRLNDKGVEVEVIGNMDLTGSNGQRGKFTRWIYRVGMARRTREGDVALSYIYYDNQDIGYPKTQEIALQIRWGYPLFIGFETYRDFDNVKGYYYNASMGLFIDLDPVQLIPRLGIGFATKKYQDFYFGVREDNFLDFTASLAAELNVWGPFFLVVRGDYYDLTRSDQRHSEKNSRRGENFWAEGSLSVRF